MYKPVIGISGSIIVDQGGMFPGYKRCYVNEDYVSAVMKAGGIPIIIPMSQQTDILYEQVEMLDGLIMSGGHDVAPRFYKQEPQPKLGEILPERDLFDFKLLELAQEKQIPVLGICRGFQIINVYLGGSLYQDLSYAPQDCLKHWQGSQPMQTTHSVKLKAGSYLEKIVNCDELMVNSFHHQIVKDVASSLNPVAYAKDGVVEAVESHDHLLVAVQWHPEMLHAVDETMQALFNDLVYKADQGGL